MTSANFAGVVREALIAGSGAPRFAAVVREALIAGSGAPRFAAVVREILRTPEVPISGRPYLQINTGR
jgi:hypothetical protein